MSTSTTCTTSTDLCYSDGDLLVEFNPRAVHIIQMRGYKKALLKLSGDVSARRFVLNLYLIPGCWVVETPFAVERNCLSPQPISDDSPGVFASVVVPLHHLPDQGQVYVAERLLLVPW
jgi:hypothetical protein